MKRQPTEAQKQAAKERRARIQQLVKQVAAMPEEKRRELAQSLPMMNPAGHMFSEKNAILISLQGGGDSTVLAGFNQWKKAGRTVKKGEHGFSIWIPLGQKIKHEDGSETTTDVDHFGTATVFDISQTTELGTKPEENQSSYVMEEDDPAQQNRKEPIYAASERLNF